MSRITNKEVNFLTALIKAELSEEDISDTIVSYLLKQNYEDNTRATKYFRYRRWIQENSPYAFDFIPPDEWMNSLNEKAEANLKARPDMEYDVNNVKAWLDKDPIELIKRYHPDVSKKERLYSVYDALIWVLLNTGRRAGDILRGDEKDFINDDGMLSLIPVKARGQRITIERYLVPIEYDKLIDVIHRIRVALLNDKSTIDTIVNTFNKYTKRYSPFGAQSNLREIYNAELLRLDGIESELEKVKATSVNLNHKKPKRVSSSEYYIRHKPLGLEESKEEPTPITEAVVEAVQEAKKDIIGTDSVIPAPDTWHCDLCDVTIKLKGKSGHIKSKKHMKIQEIVERMTKK